MRGKTVPSKDKIGDGFSCVMGLILLLIYLKQIPESLATDNVLGIGTEFLAKTSDVNIDGTVHPPIYYP